MKTYNSNEFMYILKGAEVQTEIGINHVKHIPMPDKFEFCDNLMYQLGCAIQEGDTDTINGMVNICLELSNELSVRQPY